MFGISSPLDVIHPPDSPRSTPHHYENKYHNVSTSRPSDILLPHESFTPSIQTGGYVRTHERFALTHLRSQPLHQAIFRRIEGREASTSSYPCYQRYERCIRFISGVKSPYYRHGHAPKDFKSGEIERRGGLPDDFLSKRKRARRIPQRNLVLWTNINLNIKAIICKLYVLAGYRKI